MREIIDLDGAEYLAHTYKFAQVYKQYLKDTDAVSIAMRRPELTGKETDEERARKLAEQGEKNANDTMKLLYEKKADATAKILPLLVVLDEGEELPPTRKLAAVMGRALSDSDFVSFFHSLM